MDYLKLGQLALANGDHQEAVNIFRRALEQRKSARAFSGLGKAFHGLGDYPAARWAFYKTLELEPGHEEAIHHIADIENRTNYRSQSAHQSRFRVSGDRLEFLDGTWKPLFVKGINLGVGLPGYFPGEFAVRKGTYLKWFEQMTQAGINAVRLYTIHPPSFYEALLEYNESGKKLFLLQGIWAELPENDDFLDERYLAERESGNKNVVNVIHGNADLAERPGFAHGIYAHDVSGFTIGLIFGREWESCAVKGFNDKMDRSLADYEGRLLDVHGATPFEIWTARMCDFLQHYEAQKYGSPGLVSITNWPTLDPLVHPSESDYEAELTIQGVKLRTTACNQNEDMESLDVAKFSAKPGGGFFVTYHAYPYYPDFLNNDYLQEENTYLAYLHALKKHHEGQPLLIAEFGVPSCREVSHWHRDGWHQGGHNEAEQGRINGILMKAMHQAGMAGGVLFHWFDEWYKRNWVFFPYEIPADRNPFWFNLQDAEQNYGLLAAYPGYPAKHVSLAGRLKDWRDAVTLYGKDTDSMAFRFNDGSDDVRALSRLLVKHDEGFLYMLLEAKGDIDFATANYMIGLDTCNNQAGEFLLPFKTNLRSPVGMKFLIHLAGKERSRILVCKRYDKYLNVEKGEINPGSSDHGAWVTMHNKTNARRISKDGTRFFPARVFSMSNLRFGSLERENPDCDSLADFHVSGNIIELRIPWGLINFTDPSSRTVLWKDANGMTRKTDGIRLLAVSYKPREGTVCAMATGMKHNVTDHLPRQIETAEHMKVYSWDTWETPIYHLYLKESYYAFKQVLADIPETI